MFGYAAEEYARSLAEFGEPLALPKSGGWLLSRALPEGPGRDATGCYPLFCCADWNGLSDDLQSVPAEIVSVSLVADLGRVLFTTYMFQFEVTSILIIVAMVGAVVLARKRED